MNTSMAGIEPSSTINEAFHGEGPSALVSSMRPESPPTLMDPSHGQASTTSLNLFRGGNGNIINNPQIQVAQRDVNTTVYHTVIQNYQSPLPPPHLGSCWEPILSPHSASGNTDLNFNTLRQPPAIQRVATLHLPELLGPAYSIHPHSPPTQPCRAADRSDLDDEASYATLHSKLPESTNQASSINSRVDGIQVETARFEPVSKS